jgi:hypothetical protein
VLKTLPPLAQEKKFWAWTPRLDLLSGPVREASGLGSHVDLDPMELLIAGVHLLKGDASRSSSCGEQLP